MSDVYWARADSAEPADEIEAKVVRLWESARLSQCFAKNDLCAVKLHVGEPGDPSFVSPTIVRALIARLRAMKVQPFLTDTAVLYRSPRDNGPGHCRVAHDHGFSLEAVGAPFIPADGILGADEVEVQGTGKHFEKISLATGIVQARSLLVVSHVTGHLGTGLGATLKNVGMGCCSRKAKLRQHHGHQPRISAELCIACGTCVTWCPEGAIDLDDDSARIDPDRCIGCGECVAVCREGAVEFDWGFKGKELQERIVEHAAAVAAGKPGKVGYVAVAQKITKDCDCLGLAQEPLLDDIGLLASLDPVALDQAVWDLIRQRAGKTLEQMSYPQVDATGQLAYAESIGLGNRAVNLIEV